MQDSGAGAGLYQCPGDENMRKKRIMIIGAGKSGKTTLIRAIEEDGRPVKRTPHMVYGTKTIDVPGPYLESPWMYKHIIAAAQDASCILMLADLTGEREVYSPRLCKSIPGSGSGSADKRNGQQIAGRTVYRRIEKSRCAASVLPCGLSRGTGICKAERKAG